MRYTFLSWICLVSLALCPLSVPAATEGVPPLESVTLQLKWTHAFQFAGCYAALAKGYYREAGLDVKILEATPGVDPPPPDLRWLYLGLGVSILVISLVSVVATYIYRINARLRQQITERRQAEDAKAGLEVQLLQAQRMESVGRLAGGVAHDFNNMLGVILGHAELAIEQVDPTQPIYADLIEIRKASERSAGLTRQLLAFARNQTVTLKIMNLNDVIDGMLGFLRQMIGEDIELVWAPAAGLWQIKFDPSQFDQILTNLCVNSRDAINGIGKLTIKTSNHPIDAAYCKEHPNVAPGDYVMLSVSDTGCGIEHDVLEHIFEPFFTTKAVGEGIGLGLATVYGIVTQNNGFINVESMLGQGTTFKIFLPRFLGDGVAATVSKIAEVPLSRDETVLLVEDEKSLRIICGRYLTGLGYKTLEAESPAAALDLVAQHSGPIHLLLTDVVMPGMNGRDLANKLKARYPHLKCLFMSGYSADVLARRGVIDEGAQCLSKPFSRSDLACKIREMLESKT